jgi:hypothetical protein
MIFAAGLLTINNATFGGCFASVLLPELKLTLALTPE